MAAARLVGIAEDDVVCQIIWFSDLFGDEDCVFEQVSGSCITLERVCHDQSPYFSFPG